MLCSLTPAGAGSGSAAPTLWARLGSPLNRSGQHPSPGRNVGTSPGAPAAAERREKSEERSGRSERARLFPARAHGPAVRSVCPLPACTDSRFTILPAGGNPRCAQPPAVSPRLPGAASLPSLLCHPLPLEPGVGPLPKGPRAPLPVAMQGQVSMRRGATPRPTSGSLGCPDTQQPGVRPMQTLPFAY